MRLVRHAIILLWLVIAAGVSSNVYSADQDAIRTRIGLKLFRAILAADTQINTKQGADGKLALAIIYKDDKAQADTYAAMLQNLGKGVKQGKVKGIPITVQVITAEGLEQLTGQRYAGIYLVETFASSRLQQLVDYGIAQQIISYSPFVDAVEQGISAGLIIEARTKPYVNIQTLQRSQLQIKSFFLKVSKHYEP